MNNTLINAIETCKKVKSFYIKYIAANDTKATKSHQYGYHIHKESYSYFSKNAGVKGQNIDEPITIKWQNDFETESRFKYYGQKTRNEYRITQFQRGFPFREESNIGDLLLICKTGQSYFEAFVLSADDDIEYFLSALGLSQVQVRGIVKSTISVSPENKLAQYFNQYISSISKQFPESKEMAREAERIAGIVNNINPEFLSADPDHALLDWIDIEFQLFREFEKNRYAEKLKNKFTDIDDLINFSNTILNRRKSRAGKCLENHLCSIFDANKVKYETQVRTEGNKKPDFIFPDSDAYKSKSFQINNLFFLAAKTTCKDRWRQILNEADKIKTKHLITLQQGISKNQIDEMRKHNVKLVIPAPYKECFQKEIRSDLITLKEFVALVKSKQN